MEQTLKHATVARHIALGDSALKQEQQRQLILNLLVDELKVVCGRYNLHKLQVAPIPELDSLFATIERHLDDIGLNDPEDV